MKIEKEALLDALCERVKFWTGDDSDEVRYELFCRYYENLLNEYSDSDEFPYSVMEVVDNDVVNNFNIFTEEELADEYEGAAEYESRIRAEYTASDGKRYLLVDAW